MEIYTDAEDAYEAAFYLTMPMNIDYIKTLMLDEHSDVPPILCSPSLLENRTTVKCDLGNPMIGLSKVRGVARLSSSAKDYVYIRRSYRL